MAEIDKQKIIWMGVTLLSYIHLWETTHMENYSTDAASTPDIALVGILTGSPNDLPVVVKVRDTLTELGIKSEITVASAHRTPDKVLAYLDRAHREGVQVLIGCAGVAAHLAGVVAGHTRLPVIGLPLGNGPRILALKYPEIDRALEQAARRERERYDLTADEALAKLNA